MDQWIVDWLSAERLQRYLVAAGHDSERALSLYEWNTRLNASLLHDFAHFEVGVRNLYDRGLLLSLRTGETHWLDPAPHLRLYPVPAQGRDTNLRSRREVEKARSKAGQNRSGRTSHGAVLAELTFGFWALMTAHRLERTVWPHLEQVLPAGTDRARLHESMTALNRTRNRVAHHEPTQPADAQATLRRMRRIAIYLSQDFADHMEETSTVRAILSQRP
ncbi:hypothetical protein [Brevibacterium album]|uniref:hypothetical protein n=1 Tax=Brevibacterium album TaxID=417948 RepID=UPI000491133D|nr:hypothetical protein [Brevibacterium album]